MMEEWWSGQERKGNFAVKSQCGNRLSQDEAAL